MSYFDRPRINFSGVFLASPATLNNTPNNYKPETYGPDGNVDPSKAELYWEPKGDSIIDLTDCTVGSVELPSGGRDSLLGTTVAAIYPTSPPKLVDLDPMQQNGSEIYGMRLMIGGFGGASVQGNFNPVAFNHIWANSQGKNTPRNSTSGSAVYTTTLTDLTWNVGDSQALRALKALSPDRLSLRMTVYAHNRAPDTYRFNQANFDKMAAAGVPAEVIRELTVLTEYAQQRDGDAGKQPPWNPPPGDVPTLPYVQDLLVQLLGQAAAEQWGAAIVQATEITPYAPWIDYDTPDAPPFEPIQQQPKTNFNHGFVMGSVGPCAPAEPQHLVLSRVLNPVVFSGGPPDLTQPNPLLCWAPFQLESAARRLTLDLSNSLPSDLPGYGPSKASLGTLSLAYYTVSNGEKAYTPIVASIDYSDPDLLTKKAGIVVVTDFGSIDPRLLDHLPLALLKDGTTALAEEDPQGRSLRADQFVFRMNPGLANTPTFQRGETATIDLHVRRFGRKEGTTGLTIRLGVLTQDAAKAYTLSTTGTSGTNGIKTGCLSEPRNVVQFQPTPQVRPIGEGALATVQDGLVQVPIKALDPGNPRAVIDGQIYFIDYNFAEIPYAADPNDKVSVQVYTQNPIAGTPTWENGIGQILQQYGVLYPIMGRFALWSYESVVANKEKILRVLEMDSSQPLHMPVTRDLSQIRLDLVVKWFAAGMPRGAATS